ncbi:MAG: hypothetical protein CEE43_19600 [Promethearchaeota archaeon Loki_b32]|nr:MAG: hypothetical protein CEE43_19600 [Candidatus Lokiarchaeota archaeon Loki_b32]
MPYHIAFDISHKPRGRIDENLTELRDYLNSNDFICYNFLEVPITEESLMPYDILVFVCPDFARISSLETTSIVKWVKNLGGGLLLLSHAGGDRGRGSNLSEISEQFGIAFENDQVLDDKTNLGLENIPSITAFNIPHPITAGINSLCYRSGSSLSIIGSGAFSIADSNETSEPFSCPLICVSEPEKGRVCCIGSYEMFRDKIGGGFQCDDHPQLVKNIFQWLVSDYRMELRTNVDIPTLVPQSSLTSSRISGEQEILSPSFSTDKRSIDIDFSMKISKKSELIELLKIFQNQINTIKSTIDKLIEKAIDSDNEIIELEKSQSSQTSTSSEVIKPNDQEETKSVQKTEKIDEHDYEDIFLQQDTTLTALPPKPESLKKDESDEEKSLKPPPKPKTKSKSKKELKSEKEGLKTKLTSVQDLLKFIDKKHSSGKLNDDEYVKRSKKLQSDLKKTKKRIGIIDKLIEK